MGNQTKRARGLGPPLAWIRRRRNRNRSEILAALVLLRLLRILRPNPTTFSDLCGEASTMIRASAALCRWVRWEKER